MKIVYYIILLIVVLKPIFVDCQNIIPKWESCFGGTEWDVGYSIIYVNNKYKVVGCTESESGDISFNHGSWDIWLLDLDENGNLINEKTFGGSYLDGEVVDIKMLNDSLYYIVGITKSVDGDISWNPWPGPLGNFWILQINSANEIVWEHVHGGSFKEEIRDMIITSDGGIVTLGLTASDDGDVSNHFGDYDLWMIKLNQNGEKQWDFSLGGIGYEEGGSVKQTADGGFIIAGSTDGNGGGNYDTICNYHGIEGESGGWTDAWIVKLDSMRNIEWQQCYGGKYHDDALNILEISDGYICLAITMSNDGDVRGFHGVPGNEQYGDDIWVFKIDKSGNLIWQKCLGGLYYEWARNIFPTSDGGYMIVGATQSDNGDVEGFNGLEPGFGDDVWFAKIDSLGKLQWQHCYGDIGTEDLYRGVIQKSDFNYVLALGTNSDDWQCNINTAYPDVRIAQLYDSTLVGTNNNNIPLNKQYSIVVSPNPANNNITFEYKIPESTRHYSELTIYNSSGVFIKKLDLESQSGNVTLDISSYKAGLYFYSLYSEGVQRTGKFVVK